MDEKRKWAYKRLLYASLLDMRAIAGRGSFLSNQHPYLWEFSFAFHNLARFNIFDFEGFDEDHFWRDFDILRTKFPKTNDYYKMFNDFLNEP